MGIQYSVAVNNARLDAIESTIGVSPTLELWSGVKPSNCAASDANDGELLASGPLPSDWLNNASAAFKTKAGTWTLVGQEGAGSGTVSTHFRLKKEGVCHMQGTVSDNSGDGDLKLDNAEIANGKTVTVNNFRINGANT